MDLEGALLDTLPKSGGRGDMAPLVRLASTSLNVKSLS